MTIIEPSHKTHQAPSMKESDLGVIVIIYAIATWFLIMTIQLPEPAQAYPLILISALYVCNTLLLGKQIYGWLATKTVTNDFREIFSGFQFKQFFGVIAACCVYLALLNTLGYYIASVLYLIGAQLFLKVKPLYAVISCAFVMGITYLVFTLFLKVPLPLGIFFS